MLQILVDISLEVLLQKRDMWLCKIIHKKEKKRVVKNRQVSDISKTMGT
jgi:hypothetical protein